jgi:hypothetical protein
VESSQLDAALSESDAQPTYVNFPSDAGISQEDFELLLGRPVPENLPERKGKYTVNTPLGDLGGSLAGSRLIVFFEKQIEDLVKDDPESPNALMIRESVNGIPLRSIVMMGGGRVNRGMIDGLVAMVNGRFLLGLVKALRARKKIP